MRIGIDASRYKITEPTGVEWYSFHLLNNLIPLLGRFHQHEVVVFVNGKFKANSFPFDLPFNVRLRVVERERQWTQIGLWKALKEEKVDLLFVPSHIAPLLYRGKLVTTIHDIAFKIPELKESYGWKEKMFLDWTTAWMAIRSDKIIVPSEATGNDLRKYYKWTGLKERIRVIYHGGMERSGENNPLLLKWKSAEITKFNKKFDLGKNEQIMLFIGRIELKKNILKILDAFKIFSENHKNWKLVLAGKDGHGANVIKEKIEELEMRDQVVLTGYIEEKEKKYLLSQADIFVFPSLYEGFGLPILEAFTFKKPVITSNSSSMPEVAGKAAHLVDKNSVVEICKGMTMLADDKKYTEKLSGKIEKQLDKFDWQKCAEETLEVLMESLR